MFEFDICLCSNFEDCPRKDECLRAQKLVGIHSYSLLYEGGEGCEYFIKKEKEK